MYFCAHFLGTYHYQLKKLWPIAQSPLNKFVGAYLKACGHELLVTPRNHIITKKHYSPFYAKLKHTAIDKESRLNTASSKLVLLYQVYNRFSANFQKWLDQVFKHPGLTQTNFQADHPLDPKNPAGSLIQTSKIIILKTICLTTRTQK